MRRLILADAILDRRLRRRSRGLRLDGLGLGPHWAWDDALKAAFNATFERVDTILRSAGPWPRRAISPIGATRPGAILPIPLTPLPGGSSGSTRSSPAARSTARAGSARARRGAAGRGRGGSQGPAGRRPHLLRRGGLAALLLQAGLVDELQALRQSDRPRRGHPADPGPAADAPSRRATLCMRHRGEPLRSAGGRGIGAPAGLSCLGPARGRSAASRRRGGRSPPPGRAARRRTASCPSSASVAKPCTADQASTRGRGVAAPAGQGLVRRGEQAEGALAEPAPGRGSPTLEGKRPTSPEAGEVARGHSGYSRARAPQPRRGRCAGGGASSIARRRPSKPA